MRAGRHAGAPGWFGPWFWGAVLVGGAVMLAIGLWSAVPARTIPGPARTVEIPGPTPTVTISYLIVVTATPGVGGY